MIGKFIIESELDVKQFLLGSITGVAVRRLNHGRPDALIFVNSRSQRMVIRSKSIDVSGDLEIGFLDFAIVNRLIKNEVQIEIPGVFLKSRRLNKIVLQLDGNKFDAGFIVHSSDYLPFVCLSGGVPGSLAIWGISGKSRDFRPEFAWEDYRVSMWAE